MKKSELKKLIQEVMSEMPANQPPDSSVKHINPKIERAPNGVRINGKLVDIKTFEIEDVDPRDYPDFSDAFIASGQFEDGTDMSEDELEAFEKAFPDIVWEMADESLRESKNMKTVKKSQLKQLIREVLEGIEADANGVHSSPTKLLSFLKKNVFVNFKNGKHAIGRPRLVNWVPDCPEVTKLQIGSTTFFLNDVTTFREV